jgi:hypothetical protein
MADSDSWYAKKVGPLPMGVWIAVIAGALGLAYYLNRSGGMLSASSDNQQLPQPEISTAGVAGVGRNAAGWSYSPPPPTKNPTKQKITTNNEWGQAAVKYLISQNYPPNLADSAVRNYLGGQELTSNEQALIAEVLKKLGEPPELVATHPKPPPNKKPVTPNPKFAAHVTGSTSSTITIAWNAYPEAVVYSVYSGHWLGYAQGTSYTAKGLDPSNKYIFTVHPETTKHRFVRGVSATTSGRTKAAPKPQPKPKPTHHAPHHPKPRYRYVTVGHWDSWNGSLWGIAQHYLGAGNKWHEIYNLNRGKISNPNLIYPGQRLKIPAN